MGIQDNIFDVAAALEGKPEAELFDELMTWAYRNEAELETAQSELRKYDAAMTFLGQKLGIASGQSKN